MTHFKNYNNTIDTLKQLGNNHYQIKTVTTGDIFEIDLEKNTLYPLMQINRYPQKEQERKQPNFLLSAT